MGPNIPHCYGVLVVQGGAFLVTQLLEGRDAEHSAHERAAIYEALSKLHQAGWMHNAIVTESLALRNLVWRPSGHAALIDLLTVSQHNCCGSNCEELEGVMRVLQLPECRIFGLTRSSK